MSEARSVKGPEKVSPQPRISGGLFHGFWTTLDGKRIRRATRAELADAYRLWAKHADIRTGRRTA